MGTLEKFDVEMIGATADAIDKAEDRELFRDAMTKIGLDDAALAPDQDAWCRRSRRSTTSACRRSSGRRFTLGGTGGGIAYNKAEFIEIVERGIDASPTNEVLIEE